MGFSPTSRRHYEIDEPELNLNPMMDMFGVLIPALLMMSAAVEGAVINIAAPSINPDGAPATQQQHEHPPLNVTVTISESGYTVSTMGQPIGGKTPTFPLVEK